MYSGSAEKSIREILNKRSDSPLRLTVEKKVTNGNLKDMVDILGKCKGTDLVLFNIPEGSHLSGMYGTAIS